MYTFNIIRATLLAYATATAVAAPASDYSAEVGFSRAESNPLMKRDSWCIEWYTEKDCNPDSKVGQECSSDGAPTQECRDPGFAVDIRSVKWEPAGGRQINVYNTGDCSGSFNWGLDEGCVNPTVGDNIVKGFKVV